MRILVTGANGDIAEAICRILRERYPTDVIDGADCNGTLPAACFFDRVHPLPIAKSPDFLTAFQELASHYDCVIPVPEAELAVLASQPPKWRGSLHLLMNDPRIILAFSDKFETSRWLAACGDISVKTTLLSEAKVTDLPIVAKPRFGWGSRGVQVVRSLEHLALLQRSEGDDWIAQTYLDAADCEYTCALIKDDAVINTIVMLRSLQGGLTKRATIVSVDSIEALLSAIATQLPAKAFINVQLRIFEERPQVFEINPRFSSTSMMRHLVGFRDVLWAISSFQGEVMKPVKISAGATILRLSREVVIEQ